MLDELVTTGAATAGRLESLRRLLSSRAGLEEHPD
jgi:ribosome biogenesis GTPase